MGVMDRKNITSLYYSQISLNYRLSGNKNKIFFSGPPYC